jgi:Rieske 2Fe-2S family protein
VFALELAADQNRLHEAVVRQVVRRDVPLDAIDDVLVMTHVMTPLAADRTHVECAWAFPKDVAAKEDFDPSYAVDFWDLTNRQGWAACESVQRGLSSPHARPGPLAPDEDGVYQFVTRVARSYQGRNRAAVADDSA